MGPLQDWSPHGPMHFEEPSLAWEWHFSGLILELGWVYFGPWPANLGGCTSGHLLEMSIFQHKTAILDLKPGFPLEILGFSVHFSDFLGHALEILRWTLQKVGSRWILVVGESFHVIESTSFSSPTGLPELPRAPGDPPGIVLSCHAMPCVLKSRCASLVMSQAW